MSTIYKSVTRKKFSKINLAKITIIIFSAFYLIGNFQPYYENIDPHVYGLAAIELSNNRYQISNDLLDKTGKWEFVPHQWVKTTYDTGIPKSSPGIIALGAFAYLIAQDYGLFYIGPIFTITLLIVSERITTKLFDDRIGLLTLLLLSTNFMIFTVGNHLVTDTIFTVLIISGIYFLLKFLKYNQNHAIILSSLFFAIASLIRLVGIIFLPIELFIFISYFVFSAYKNKTLNGNTFKRFFRLISKKKTIQFIALLIIPWIGLSVFYSSYNSYYFGSPSTNYGNLVPKSTILSELTVNQTEIIDLSSITFSDDLYFSERSYTSETFSKRILLIEDRVDVAKGYFLYLLPSQFPWAQTLLEHHETNFGKDFLGIIPIFFLGSITILSVITKAKFTEIMVFVLCILSLIGIYTITSIPSDIVGRYMLPAIPLFSIILGYTILKIFESIPKVFASRPILSKIIKDGFLILLIIYFLFVIYISDPIQWIISENFIFKNPDDYTRIYPLDREGLSENDILVNYFGTRAVEHNLIPFNGHVGNYYLDEIEDRFSPGSVELLKIAINSDYNAYVLKNPKQINDIEYFTYILNEHDLVLKDFSKSFCKIEIGNNLSGMIMPSPDPICYIKTELPLEKRWYDQILN